VGPAAEPEAGAVTGRPESPSAAALATRRLCPYLAVDGGAWRSATPDREHRCGALTPMPLLTLDKQRRLCLTDRHLSCATYLAAKGEGSDAGAGSRRLVAVGPGREASPEGVTRWAIVRTAPVILDHTRVPVVGSLPRGRLAGQLGLGILLVAAFAALAIGRLSGQAGPALGGGTPSQLPGSSAAAAGRPSPSAEVESSPPSEPTATPTPTRTAGATAGASPSTAASPAVTTRYRVKNGDTLYSIAIRFKTTVKVIQQLNHLTSTTLHIGQFLNVPSG
jgi:LysM repeat protein